MISKKMWKNMEKNNKKPPYLPRGVFVRLQGLELRSPAGLEGLRLRGRRRGHRGQDQHGTQRGAAHGRSGAAVAGGVGWGGAQDGWMGEKLWKITIFNGKTHYFYGHFQ